MISMSCFSRIRNEGVAGLAHFPGLHVFKRKAFAACLLQSFGKLMLFGRSVKYPFKIDLWRQKLCSGLLNVPISILRNIQKAKPLTIVKCFIKSFMNCFSMAVEQLNSFFAFVAQPLKSRFNDMHDYHDAIAPSLF